MSKMLRVITTFTKQMVLVLVLIVGTMLLWDIPEYDKNSLSHKDHLPKLTTNLPSYEIQTFLKHISTRLPQYRKEFEQAEGKTGISWVLLASMAYQESKWNRHAVSPTGVRGLMMLTRSTAADLGITNRLDPQKSIAGGARYLAHLHQRVPKDIGQSDRLFVALAAYNVGLGHIHDARTLAKRLGKNERQWEGLSEVLPLLAEKKYYQDLPHRYARGAEPVQYVKRIRAYRKILAQVVKQEDKRFLVEI